MQDDIDNVVSEGFQAMGGVVETETEHGEGSVGLVALLLE